MNAVAVRREMRYAPSQQHPMSIAPEYDLERVALIDPSDFTLPYDLALARAIKAEGRDVRLVGQAGKHPFPQQLRYEHFYTVLASQWGQRLPSGAVRLIKGASHGVDMLLLSRWLTAFGARIVHFQWSPLPVIDRWLIRSLRRRWPVVLTMHDSNPYQGTASWLMRRGYGSLLNIFDAIIVHTRQAERRIAEIGIDPDRIHRIPHGLLSHAGCPAKAAAGRSPRDRLVLMQFGKIRPYKGIDLLLEALALLPQPLRERLDVRIIGKPYMDTAAMEQFVGVNDLASCVSFRFEFVSDAEEHRLFGEADAVLLPYREIDASGVAMTAVAHAVPVLATAIEGFRELFEGEGGACLVPPGDPASLCSVITDWINAPQQLDGLKQSMRLRRATIPSWNEIARLHFAVYAEARAHWMAERERSAATARQ